MTTPGSPTSSRSGAVVVGLIADPSPAPERLARLLSDDLPELLAERLKDEHSWRVEIVTERLPASDASHSAMIELARERTKEHDWDIAVCVTDLPMRSGKRPIVADVARGTGVAVVSLPAFGAMSLRRRVRGVVAQVIVEMQGEGQDPAEQQRQRPLPELPNRFRRVTPDADGIDVRILANRGGMRLLVGMVRDNHPWRLVFGLTGPLVGAFAFSAFYVISSIVWQLSNTIGPLRLTVAMVGAVGIMIGWLIGYHHLWEPAAGRPRGERDEAMLFNASTVLTLMIGVGCMYVGLLVVNFLVVNLIIADTVLAQYVGGPPGLLPYANIAWLVTSAATIAGAVGSGFETEESVRQAAYSHREQERRSALSESEPDPEDSEASRQQAA